MSNESTRKTFLVAFLLCIVCSVVVSTAAVSLRPMQAANKALDRKTNILLAAGLIDQGQKVSAGEVESLFAKVTTKVVDLNTGKYTDAVDPTTYDQKKAAKDPSLSTNIPADNDIAKIKSREDYSLVYLIEGANGDVEKVVLPVKGYGLWSTLYGFIALESDLNTVAGLGFYEHAETPGLGGEVDNPRWKQQWGGKKVYEDGEVELTVIKGQVDTSRPDAQYKVDGLSGATLTTRGIDNLVKYWMGDEGFAQYLENLKAGEA